LRLCVLDRHPHPRSLARSELERFGQFGGLNRIAKWDLARRGSYFRDRSDLGARRPRTRSSGESVAPRSVCATAETSRTIREGSRPGCDQARAALKRRSTSAQLTTFQMAST
jgi:hypothetical protein